MREVVILLERDLKMLKNYLLAMRHNPKRLLVFLLYLAYMIWVVWINRSNSGGGSGAFNPAFMGGATMIYVAMTLLINISVSLKEMLSFFKPADVSIVFTSPLKPRAVMAAALIKSAMGSVLLTLFLVVIGGRYMLPAGVPNTGYILMILLFVLFNMSIQPLNFMLIRFKTRFPIMTTQVVFTALWLLPTLILLLVNGADVLGFPVWSNTNWIPVVGWLKALVLAGYGYEVPGVWIIACLYCLYTLGVLFGAIFLATDYYEDVIAGTEKFASLRQRAKEGKQAQKNTKTYKKKVLSLKKNPQPHVATTSHQDDGKYLGELAFFWKEKTIATKVNFHPVFGNKEILYLIGALAVTVASYFVPEDLKWIAYGYNGGLIYIIFLMTLSGKGQVEFMTPRFLMTPGKITVKLLGIYGLPAIRHSLAMVLVNLVLLASDSVSPLIILICFVGQIILYIEVLYINLLMHGFLQNSTDVAVMLPLMKVIQIVILLAPNVLLAIQVGMMTESFYWVALALGVLNILIIGILVLLTSWFVKRIEVLN